MTSIGYFPLNHQRARTYCDEHLLCFLLLPLRSNFVGDSGLTNNLFGVPDHHILFLYILSYLLLFCWHTLFVHILSILSVVL